jgi:hypothetical protein
MARTSHATAQGQNLDFLFIVWQDYGTFSLYCKYCRWILLEAMAMLESGVTRQNNLLTL